LRIDPANYPHVEPLNGLNYDGYPIEGWQGVIIIILLCRKALGIHILDLDLWYKSPPCFCKINFCRKMSTYIYIQQIRYIYICIHVYVQ